MSRISTSLRSFAILSLLFSNPAHALVCPVYLMEDAFKEIFHDMTPASEQTVTSLREELKVMVTEAEAGDFLNTAKRIVTNESSATIGMRDTPPIGKDFVTDTWYWHTYKSTGQEIEKETDGQFKAVLRARLYEQVDADVRVSDLPSVHPENSVPLNPVSLGGDPNVVYRKFEFKVGHPSDPESGISGQIPGVVDKPGVILPEKDILLLLRDKTTFKKNQARILRQASLLEKDGVRINSPATLEEMLRRVEKLHAEAPEPVGSPVVRIRYKREAWQANFTSIDPETGRSQKIPVQITFDREVKLEDFTSGRSLEFNHSNFALAADGTRKPVTVVEFKVPLAYAKLTDSELSSRGLGALAKLRSTYRALSAVKRSTRNSGKQAEGLRMLRKKSHE